MYRYLSTTEHSMDMHYVSMDHRGHGLSKWDKHKDRTDGPVDWNHYGRDITQVTKQHMESLSLSPYGNITDTTGNTTISTKTHKTIGVGHSMGATALILSALENPALYSGGLILFEPILFPGVMRFFMNLKPDFDAPLATVSRRRKEMFPSYQFALSNFSSKPPLKSFHPAVTQDYVQYGFAPTDNMDTHIADYLLASESESESGSSSSSNYTDKEIALLEAMNVPIWVVASKYEMFHTSMMAYFISKKIPNSRFLQWDDAGHFGPMQHPHRLGDLIREMSNHSSNSSS